ncbi:NYN domain-containing protein [candidate division KSB1 bacterium]|nr:NYN domain-containing protein [candidate division KSB1 bacterium]NIR71422.1 NYN domain-containing protein [candidate division KSB1 bacterium]NIS23343.1 NYN domain-containing protein [candidate division KSB1 bacterium]NIT70234.1 NYN domain-containing protein [candidate division KSB1 bacterium]NIU23957.1 NYN domain-containing protein [candidate division KSB1 bacterium]
MDGKLTRIGIFYDGNYFFHVSNFYAYQHPRKARINIRGLHALVRKKVAELEGTEERFCQIVDVHYFRGRLSAAEAQQRDILYNERVFHDVLIREGVTTHFLPLSRGSERGFEEKGIDVWLALEAFELTLYKKFTVAVLIAGDGDYVPLVRKLNTLGTRVMVLGSDFDYVDSDGEKRTTRTSKGLLDEVTYPMLLNEVIDDRSKRNSHLVNQLFVTQKSEDKREIIPPSNARSSKTEEGIIVTLQDGYGFLKPDGGGQNLFFFHTEVQNTDFNSLVQGDRLRFERGANQRGECAVKVFLLETT